MYQYHLERSVKSTVATTAETEIERWSFLIVSVEDNSVNVQLRKVGCIRLILRILQREFTDISTRTIRIKICHYV